jgi:hypothetical protein
MADNFETQLKESLEQTPPLPETIYPALLHRLRRRSAIIKAVWSVAATIVVAVGIGGYQYTKSTRLSTDVSDEIQYVGTYLNGDDVANDVDEYVLVDVDN